MSFRQGQSRFTNKRLAMLEESLSSFHSIDEAEEEEEEFKDVKEENVSQEIFGFFKKIHVFAFFPLGWLLASLLHQTEEVRQAKGEQKISGSLWHKYRRWAI